MESQRQRLSKTLEGLPPRSERAARIDYIWRRIQSEAQLILNEQNLEAEFTAAEASRGASSSSRVGRRTVASVSVARQMTYFFLSCDRLFHSVARRIASLIAPRQLSQQRVDGTELDHDEILDYFAYYNDWKFDSAAEQKEQEKLDAAVSQKRKLGCGGVSGTSTPVPPVSPVSVGVSAPGAGAAASKSSICTSNQQDQTIAEQLRTFEQQRERFAASLERSLEEEMCEDLIACYDRDPASLKLMEPLLYFKGFHALQLHRLCERLWFAGEVDFALLLQSVTSRLFAADIHPAARIGSGVMLDHGTGVVIGETAVVGNRVSILHNVTLGGTGKAMSDRHPKVGHDVLLGAGALVLGNVRVGNRARIAAGACVVKSVPDDATVVGVAAKPLPNKEGSTPVRLPEQPLNALSLAMLQQHQELLPGSPGPGGLFLVSECGSVRAPPPASAPSAFERRSPQAGSSSRGDVAADDDDADHTKTSDCGSSTSSSLHGKKNQPTADDFVCNI